MSHKILRTLSSATAGSGSATATTPCAVATVLQKKPLSNFRELSTALPGNAVAVASTPRCTLFTIGGGAGAGGAPAPFNLSLSGTQLFGTSATVHQNDWRRQMDMNQQRRKVIPQLIYLHNPWKYVLTKLNLWRLRLFWDRDFVEEEFIRGSKQAAILLTKIIRLQRAEEIGNYTTPLGFQQITRDMLLSKNDKRLKLVKFETEHLRRAIPMKVATRIKHGRRYCFIDMLFVGLRNTKDFDTAEEVVEVKQVLDTLDADMKLSHDVLDVPHRIVFAEIFMRFRRDYSAEAGIEPHNGEELEKDWSVSFYKILSFDVLNYSPQT